MFLRLLALLLLTVTLYANSLHGAFIFDDLSIVFSDPALLNVKTFTDAVQVAWRQEWRAALEFTYALNYWRSGRDTTGYHAVNILIHVVNVWLVYGILLALKVDRNAALFAAAIFAADPLFTGAVSYIAGRSSELCATFYFAAVWLFLKGRRWWIPAALSGVLAFSVKQEAAALPLLIITILLLRDQIRWRWLFVPGIAVLPILFVMREHLAKMLYITSHNTVLVAAGFNQTLAPAQYIPTYLAAVVGYILPRFLFPFGLSVDPDIPLVEHWYSPECLFSVAVIATFLAVIWLIRKSYSLLAIAFAAILISPLMLYSVIPLADVVLEHRLYIPGLGIALMAAWAYQRGGGWKWAGLILLPLSGLMTVARNPVYANGIRLWEAAVQESPSKARPHFNLAQAYQENNRIPDALVEYQKALALRPDIAAAYSNLAAIYLDHGQFDAGEQVLIKATAVSPTFTEGWINLAVLYLRERNPAKALVSIDKAIALSPESFAAEFNKGEILTMMGRFPEALTHYERAAALRPDMEAFTVPLENARKRVQAYPP